MKRRTFALVEPEYLYDINLDNKMTLSSLTAKLQKRSEVN